MVSVVFSLTSLKRVNQGIDGAGSEVNGAREVNEGLGKFVIKTGSNSYGWTRPLWFFYSVVKRSMIRFLGVDVTIGNLDEYTIHRPGCKQNGVSICAVFGIHALDNDDNLTSHVKYLLPAPNCMQASAVVWEHRIGIAICAKCVLETTLNACKQVGEGCKYLSRDVQRLSSSNA